MREWEGFGGATAGAEVLPFAKGEGGGFLDADDIVFEAEEGVVDFVFVLVMFGEDAGAVFESEDARGSVEGVVEAGQDALAEVVEAFDIGFGGFPEEEALEAGEPLAIIGADLGEEPVGFAGAASAAVADGGGAAGLIAEAGGGAGSELAGLKENAGADEVLDLIVGTAGRDGVADELGGVDGEVHTEGLGVEAGSCAAAWAAGGWL